MSRIVHDVSSVALGGWVADDMRLNFQSSVRAIFSEFHHLTLALALAPENGGEGTGM